MHNSIAMYNCVILLASYCYCYYYSFQYTIDQPCIESMVFCLHIPNFVNASWYKELAWGIEPIRVAERVCSFR